MKQRILFLMALALAPAAVADLVKGFSLTEIWNNDASSTTVSASKYDANLEPGANKTDAQKTIDRLYNIGVRRINLSPQAHMRNPKQSFVKPSTVDIPEEIARMKKLIAYIHGKGMSIGIRPILFLLNKNGQPGITLPEPDGKSKYWWHGNIQPRNVDLWFEHYRTYLSNYYPLAKEPGVEEFSIGSELYSMTCGLEKEWEKEKYGFPRHWAETLREAKKNIPAHVTIMYDINFTDDSAQDVDISRNGGEWARWVYRLTMTEVEPDPFLVEFWNGLGAIGIDNYRSLVREADLQDVPTDYAELVDLLESNAGLYANQIRVDLDKISERLRSPVKDVVLKEIGYTSSDNGFYKPFEFAGKKGTLNLMHQAAAYEATMRAFWKPGFKWLKGIVFWDASVSQGLHGKNDVGFSPLGKPETEKVIHDYWK